MLSYFQKFTSFLNKWTGKRDDFDGAYGAQCVDLARQYCNDTGFPIGPFGGSAINGWNTAVPFVGRPYVRVAYNGTNFPNAGDVVFFAQTRFNGNNGHVAIAGTDCNAEKLDIIEQNAGKGNGSGTGADAVTRRTITYNDQYRGRCLGWFARKS